MTPFPPKTPRQMRREVERPINPRPPKAAGEIDPARRPPPYLESRIETDAATDWLAHVAAGRIEVR